MARLRPLAPSLPDDARLLLQELVQGDSADAAGVRNRGERHAGSYSLARQARDLVEFEAGLAQRLLPLLASLAERFENLCALLRLPRSAAR